MLRKFRELAIRALSEKDTVYLGNGVYNWVNHEGKIVIRSDQRIVAPFDFRLHDTDTTWIEKAQDDWENWLNRAKTTTVSSAVIQDAICSHFAFIDRDHSLLPPIKDLYATEKWIPHIREFQNRSKK